MSNRFAVLTMPMIVLFSVAELRAQSASQKAFIDTLKGSAVTLLTDLYTIGFVAEGALGTSPKQSTQPMLVISSDQMFYEVTVRNDKLADDQPERLADQVKTKVASRSAMQEIFGAQPSNVKTGEVQLSKYASGEQLIVKDVRFRGNDIVVELSKPFARNQTATGFIIRLQGRPSREFAEWAQVQGVVDKVLARK